jgi:hypothetical protein
MLILAASASLDRYAGCGARNGNIRALAINEILPKKAQRRASARSYPAEYERSDE